ncbi:unnamed protein product, partial [Pylaiella littoralis]
MADPTGGGAAQPVSQPTEPSSRLIIGGVPVQVVGAGKGRSKQTSAIWKHVVEFTPATASGKNIKCMVKHKLPAVNNVPAREVTCGFLMKYVRADASKGISSGGTNGMWKHFRDKHKHIREEEMPKSSHSTEGKKRKASLLAGVQQAQASAGKGPMDKHMITSLGKAQQEEQNRRYVAMCAVDFRPFSMFDSPAFRWYLGGFSPAYIQNPMHATTIDGHLDQLCLDVRSAMTAKLTEQYESVQAAGWNGPWISIQCDATSTNN